VGIDEQSPCIRIIDTAQTIPLRLAVLRPGRPIETTRFEGDDDPATRHFGLFQGAELVAIASLFRAELPEQPADHAYQLRGMATAPGQQKKGFGRLLLSACLEYARQNGAALLWCNARRGALGFYQKSGFDILGDEFDISDVGPHFRMYRKLNTEY